MRLRSPALGATVFSALLAALMPAATSFALEPSTDCSDPAIPCLGPLAAGEHATVAFAPGDGPGVPGGLRFEVPEGWALVDDSASSVWIAPDWEFARDDLLDAQAANGIEVWAHSAAASLTTCGFVAEPGVGLGLTDLVAFVTAHPGIVSGDPVPMSLGDHPAVAIDVAMAPTWTATCPGLEVIVPAAPVLVEAAPEPGYVKGLTPGVDMRLSRARLILVEVGETNVASVWIWASTADRFDAFAATAQPIVESMRFTP